MPLKVVRKEKESSRRLIRRFSQILRRTGIFRQVRLNRFYRRPLSKTKKKLVALRRERVQQERSEKERLGKL